MICKTNIPIIKITSGDGGGGGGGYVRAMGVPNGEDIIENAPDFEVEGVVYKPIYYLALRDTFIIKTFTKTGDGVSTGADAYLFSDDLSNLQVGDSVTHTFDPTKDFSTDQGWKCRYAIMYATADNKALATGRTVNLYNFTNTFELVGASGTIFSSYTVLFGKSQSPGNLIIKYVNILSCSFYTGAINKENFMRYCSALQELKLPNTLTSIKSYGLENCTALVSIDLKSLTSIPFQNLLTTCRCLKNVDLENVASIGGGNSLYNMSSLQSVNLPLLTSISGSNVLSNNPSLKEVNCPLLNSITANSVLINNYNLNYINLSSITTWTNTTATTLNYTQFIKLPTNFDIDAVNLTGTVPKSYEWLNVELPTKLKDNSGGTAKTLTIGSANIALITPSNQAIITNKNWTLL